MPTATTPTIVPIPTVPPGGTYTPDARRAPGSTQGNTDLVNGLLKNTTDLITKGKLPKRKSGSSAGVPVGGFPLGFLALGAVAVVAMADSKAAPLAVAFLTAAVVYNLNAILPKVASASANAGTVTGFIGPFGKVA